MSIDGLNEFPTAAQATAALRGRTIDRVQIDFDHTHVIHFTDGSTLTVASGGDPLAVMLADVPAVHVHDWHTTGRADTGHQPPALEYECTGCPEREWTNAPDGPPVR